MSADPTTLAEPLRSSVVALLREANDGATRVVVVSARRDRAEQIALRRAHCGESDYAVFQKPSMECNPPTARPGESQHELGRAVDFGGDLALVERLAPKYGLVQTVAGERWHFESSGAARVAGSGDGAAPAGVDVAGAVERSGGSGGGLVGSALGNVPLVGGALSAVWGWKDALVELVRSVVNPRFWLRVLGAIAGVVLITIGAAMIGLDVAGLRGGGDVDAGDVVMAAV